jgi:MFS family permease
MQKNFTAIAFLFVAAIMLMTSAGLLGSFISLRTLHEGLGNTVAGSMMSAYYLGLIIGARRCAGLINRVGHIRAFSAFCSVNIVAVLIFPLLINSPLWLILRIIIGFNMAGLFMVMESWLNAQSDGRHRGALMAAYTAATYLAMGGGQLLLNVREISGPDLFLISAILLALAALPVINTRTNHPAPVSGSRFRFRQLWKISPIAICTCIGAGALSGAVFGVGPIFGRDLGLDVKEISLLMFVITASGIVLQWPLGRLSDRLDRRTVIVGVALCTAAASVAILPTIGIQNPTVLANGSIANTSSSIPMMFILGIFGATIATLYPLGVAWANDRLSEEQLVGASGGLVMAYGIGAIFGPLGANLMMSITGPLGLFYFTTIVALLVSLFALRRIQVQEPVAEADKERFIALPEATSIPVANALDSTANRS